MPITNQNQFVASTSRVGRGPSSLFDREGEKGGEFSDATVAIEDWGGSRQHAAKQGVSLGYRYGGSR